VTPGELTKRFCPSGQGIGSGDDADRGGIGNRAFQAIPDFDARAAIVLGNEQ